MKVSTPITIDCIKLESAILKQSHPHRSQLTGLYAITDASGKNLDTLIRQVEQALIGGVRIIQYRDKSTDAKQRLEACQLIRKLTRQYNALLIVNDDVELARTIQADGVHLGKDDMDIEQARAQLGQTAIIGVSCYNRFDLAEQALKAGADYIAFGSFFPSTTKPEAATAKPALLTKARETLDIPVVAIGGITTENGRDLIEAGADMLAVVNGLFGQSDIESRAKRFCSLFHNDQRTHE